MSIERIEICTSRSNLISNLHCCIDVMLIIYAICNDNGVDRDRQIKHVKSQGINIFRGFQNFPLLRCSVLSKGIIFPALNMHLFWFMYIIFKICSSCYKTCISLKKFFFFFFSNFLNFKIQDSKFEIYNKKKMHFSKMNYFNF